MGLTVTLVAPGVERVTGEGTDRWAEAVRRDKRSWHLRRSDGVECGGEMSLDFAHRWMVRWVAGGDR